MIEFFTATCLSWQPLLSNDRHKEIIMESLEFLVMDKRISLYGFVIMPNHLHLLWQRLEQWQDKNVQHSFLRYTSQQIKFHMLAINDKTLINYESSLADRKYQFWERNSFTVPIRDQRSFATKLNYIHQNPVRWGLCKNPAEYKFSTASFYENRANEWQFVTRREHLS